MAFQFHQQTGASRRTRFATLSGAYHGDTVGAVSVGAIPLFHEVYRPLLFQCVVLPAPRTAGGEEEAECLAQALTMLEEHGETLAALVMEPLCQGAAGLKMHSPEFARTLAQRARDLGVLVVFDEVAVGFGRTGSMFATEIVGITPDFLCLAKGLSGGYLPLAATLTTTWIYDAFLGPFDAWRQLFHGHTFTGNPLACAVALASLDRFEHVHLLDHVREVSKTLADGVARLVDPHVFATRQLGLMVGIDLQRRDGTPYAPADRAGHRAAMETRQHGAIVRPLGDTLVLNPPLAITHDEVNHLMNAVSLGLRALP